MKTAVMFAGVDALDLKAQRMICVHYPEVSQRVAQAQKVLNSIDPKAPSLLEHITSDDQVYRSSFALMAIGCTAVQVGLYDRFIKNNPRPDYLLGCSLGDNARTICSGAVNFEDMIYGTYLFSCAGQNIEGGALASVRSTEPMSDHEEKSITDYGLTVAVHQTPHHFLISGPAEKVKLWTEEVANPRGYKTRYMHDKPLHSPQMNPAYAVVDMAFQKSLSSGWNIPMVSTVFEKLITDETELRQDLKQNMTGSVRWQQSMKWVIEELNVSTVFNIGPIPTLINFLDRIPFSNPVNKFHVFEGALA